nr:MAG TPA: Penaeidin [Caudoviricetes sp.]
MWRVSDSNRSPRHCQYCMNMRLVVCLIDTYSVFEKS